MGQKLPVAASAQTQRTQGPLCLMRHAFELRLKAGRKKVTVFRRKPWGAWQIRIPSGKRRVWHSLKVTGQGVGDLDLVKARARFKLEEASEKPFAPKRVATRMATLGAVIERYKERATAVGYRHAVGRATALANVRHLRRLVRIAEGLGDDAAVDAMGCEVLGKGLVTRFIERYLRRSPRWSATSWRLIAG